MEGPVAGEGVREEGLRVREGKAGEKGAEAVESAGE